MLPKFCCLAVLMVFPTTMSCQAYLRLKRTRALGWRCWRRGRGVQWPMRCPSRRWMPPRYLTLHDGKGLQDYLTGLPLVVDSDMLE